jgi:hypothetical protein
MRDEGEKMKDVAGRLSAVLADLAKAREHDPSFPKNRALS